MRTRLSVRQALVSVAYDVEISDVKTGTGAAHDRPRSGTTVDVLKAWKIERAEGEGWHRAQGATSWCS